MKIYRPLNLAVAVFALVTSFIPPFSLISAIAMWVLAVGNLVFAFGLVDQAMERSANAKMAMFKAAYDQALLEVKAAERKVEAKASSIVDTVEDEVESAVVAAEDLVKKV